MAIISQTGATWFGQRLGFLLNGILGAYLFLLLDWCVPPWLKDIYILYDSFLRARAIDRVLRENSHPLKTRVACFAIPSTCLAIIRIWFVPKGREILYHHGAVGYVSPLGIHTWEYLISDGTPDERKSGMLAQRDAAVCYFLTVYVWIHRWWAWWLFCDAVLWVGLPIVCFSSGLWMVWNHLPGVLQKILMHLIGQAAALFMWTWDFCDIVEAHFMERFPKWVQYKLHRFQQHQRRRKDLPTYIYSPLQPGEIRLLRLKRTSWWLPGSIKAELFNVAMYPSPEYEAVSYRWGSPERTESIVLEGGTTLPITRSAYDLLIARRSMWRTRTLWIDVICINQSDDREKAAQVQLMREIYHRAYRVIVFPGGDWTARLAAPLLYETLAAMYQFDDSILGLNKLSNGEKSTIKWKALRELIFNDYFTRSWVVQEVSVGQKVELYYGGLYIRWSVFFELAMHLAHPHRREMLKLGDRKDRAVIGISTLENIAIMSFFRPDSAAFGDDLASRTGLDAVLFATFTFESTDPRDKVFAVLGVARYNDPEGLLMPDYSKSVSQVYRDTAEFIYFHSDEPSILMLALAGIGNSRSRLLMPSWVPCLNQEHLWFPYTDFITKEGNFRASGDRAPDFQRGDLPDSLSIKGILCDKIVSLGISTVYQNDIPPREQQDTAYVTHHKWTIVKDIVMSIQKHKDLWPENPDVVDSDLGLALVAGRILRKQPSADHGWGKVFRHWLSILEKLPGTGDGHILREEFGGGELGDPSLEIPEADVLTYDSALEGCCGRRFAITQQGRLCWVPPYAETGDFVFVPLGAQTPFLVRAQAEFDRQDVFELVGESYVQGIMWGELVESDHQESVITLV